MNVVRVTTISKSQYDYLVHKYLLHELGFFSTLVIITTFFFFLCVYVCVNFLSDIFARLAIKRIQNFLDYYYFHQRWVSFFFFFTYCFKLSKIMNLPSIDIFLLKIFFLVSCVTLYIHGSFRYILSTCVIVYTQHMPPVFLLIFISLLILKFLTFKWVHMEKHNLINI